MKKQLILIVLLSLGTAAARAQQVEPEGDPEGEQEVVQEAPAGVQGWGARTAASATSLEEPDPLHLVLPTEEIVVDEGQLLQRQLTVTGGGDGSRPLRFAAHPAVTAEGVTVEADSTGRLTFSADYPVASRQEPFRSIPVNVLVTDALGQKTAGVIHFSVRHVNRAPGIHELPPGYARPGEPFVFDLSNWVKDEDGDPVTFSASLRHVPENATLTPAGVFTWNLSSVMFDRLPREIPFVASDGIERTEGTLVVRRSEAGLPPRITLLGRPREILMNEGERINLLLDIMDPNGADDLSNVYPTTSLLVDHYRFTWPLNGDRTKAEFVFQPDHDFVEQGQKSQQAEVSITAVDRDRKESAALVVRFTVGDAPDPDRLYREYRSTLENATALLQQLTEKEQELDARLVQVRQSERMRRIVNAALGMTTAAFGLFTSDQTQKIGAGFGGLLTTGLSALEAAKIFTAPETLERQLQDIKTEILRVRFEAEGFAREYSNPERRASAAFGQDRRNSDKLILDARTKLKVTEPVSPVTDEEIKRFTVYFTGQ